MARTAAFDQLADRYDAWFERYPAAYASELNAIRAVWPAGAQTLEIGVGTGRFAASLGIRYGVDPSPAMRAKAQQRGITVLAGTAEALPFPEKAFEAVLMVTTLCFTDDPQQALKEAYRVLQPGGYLVIGFIDRASPLGQRYLARQQTSPFYQDAHFHAADEVKALLQTTGFTTLSWRQTLFSDPEALRQVDPVRKGYGQGGFVVVRARRPLGSQQRRKR